MTTVSGDWLRSSATQAVFDALEAEGHSGYFVGGCVRNALLGMPVSDIDITTAATPDQVIEAAKKANLKSLPTGIEHGTITVLSGGIPHEITTFRRDIETDGRHAEVAFASSMNEDAARRDFTMNALYADRDGVIFDPVGGLPDLAVRRLRFIGEADARIKEDYLRVLRFFRFHAWYGDASQGLDADGLAACASAADALAGLSAERVGAEMKKLLLAPDPSMAVAAMAQAGVLAQIMPGADAKALPILIHFEEGRPSSAERRIACLGGDSVKESWRLSKAEASKVDLLREMIGQSTGLAEIAYRHGAEVGWDVALLRGALFETPLVESTNRLIEEGSNAVFPVKAADLMPDVTGPELGALLKDLEARWIASGFKLTKAGLMP